MTLLVRTSAPAPDSVATALKFGKNPGSYILLPSDTSPLTSSLSVCAWVKRQSNHLDFYQYWISYGVRGSISEFGISDTGVGYMFGDGMMPRYQGLTVEEYHHICLTWGGREVVLYYDGQEIGRERTPAGRDLITPGTLILGQFVPYIGLEHVELYRYFGGELTGVNVFTGQLTGREVVEVYQQGMCADYSTRYGEDGIFSSWQNILRMERFGDVQEVEVRCSGEAQEFTKSKKKRAVKEENYKQNPRNMWDFLYGAKFYEELITLDLIEEMRLGVDLLTDFIGHRVDENLINHLKKHRD